MNRFIQSGIDGGANTVKERFQFSVHFSDSKGTASTWPGVVFQEDFDAPFCLLEFCVAKTGQLDALLEQFQGRIQRKLSVFELPDDFFESLQRGFEIRGVRHEVDCR